MSLLNSPILILVVKYILYAVVGMLAVERLIDKNFRSKYPVIIPVIENRGGQKIIKYFRGRRIATEEGEPKFEVVAGLRKKILDRPAFAYKDTYPALEYGPFREKFTTSVLAYSPKEKNIKPIHIDFPFIRYFNKKTKKAVEEPKPGDEIKSIGEIVIPAVLTVMDENDRLWVIRESIKAIRHKWLTTKHPVLLQYGGLLLLGLAITFVMYGGAYFVKETATVSCSVAKGIVPY